MKKILTIIVAAAAACSLAQAQGINQSVQVTNKYESEFADFKKPEPELTLPDTLYRFDYNFDYSVFDTPYTGSYQFSPYNIDMVPEIEKVDVSRFYLKAGAGYTMHPVLDLVYTPLSRPRASLSIYNFGRGYDGSGFHDFSDRFGVKGNWTSGGSLLSYDLGYDGIFAGAVATHSTAYHSAFARLSLSSVNALPTFLSYKLWIDYRFSDDHLPAAEATTENRFSIGGSVGPVIATDYRFLFDFNFSLAALNDYAVGSASRSINLANFYPHIELTPGIFDIDAGLVIDCLIRENSSFTLVPSVSAGVDLIDGAMSIRAAFKGGMNMLDYHSLKTMNHFYTRTATDPDVSRTRYDASLAMTGRIGTHFHYELRGGFASLVDSPLDSYMVVAFADYDLVYATAELDWRSEFIDVDADFRYGNAIINPAFTLYEPSKFTADARVTYNYRKRIFAAVFVEAATARTDPSALLPEVPGFADLGIEAEYRFRKSFSLWLKAGNLLCGEIQRHPGYVESGPYATIGIKLAL